MAIVTKPSLLAMADRWPSAYVARQEIENFTGGVMTDKYISWLDLKGKGPKNRVRMGRKIAYPVKELIFWLESRSEFVEADGENTSTLNIQRR
jgi:hypothetical protein